MEKDPKTGVVPCFQWLNIILGNVKVLTFKKSETLPGELLLISIVLR